MKKRIFSMMAVTATVVSASADLITGRVFNLQRCSVHDGPGIRTTVFLKGCPLRCTWCHNPEGIDAAPELMLNRDRCLDCGSCSGVCPVTVGGAAPVGEPWDPDACTQCGACVEVCPGDARELAGREYSAGELVDLVERDRPFFESSGGGITFSGGEPLSQLNFLMECLRRCRERGLSTAVDTCGLAPLDSVLEAARHTDLLLIDLKHMDPDKHRRHTGVSNGQILENMRALSAGKTEIWVRLPLIAGVNDDDDHLDAVGSFLASLPRRHRVFVLPYHGTAAGKTLRLTKTSSFPSFQTPVPERLGEVRRRLERFGLEVSVGGSP